MGDEGALIDVRIGVGTARQTVLERNQLLVPRPVLVRAVIDTGAYRSGIDRRVLEALELPGEVDVVNVHTPSTVAGQPHRTPVYVVSLDLLIAGYPLRFQDLFVMATEFTDQEEARAIIGREVLAHCHFEYDGPSRTFQIAF